MSDLVMRLEFGGVLDACVCIALLVGWFLGCWEKDVYFYGGVYTLMDGVETYLQTILLLDRHGHDAVVLP